MSTSPVLSRPVSSVQAAPHWQRVDFISDLHLDVHARATFDVWARHMAQTPADALFILGDLFEVWVGDDNPDPFALQCQQVLQTTAQRIPVYFMCGNRDFLVGPALLQRTGLHGLNDPTVLDLTPARPPTTTRFLLSHGDALCLDDHAYLAFRTQVRQADWQTEFLSKPLAERQAYASSVRNQSEARKQLQPLERYADVNAQAAIEWLSEAQADVLIHGHTHQPATHDLAHGLSRWVLSDWDANSQPPRLEVLRWLRDAAAESSHGLHRLPLSL